MTDKRQKATKVKCKRGESITKKSIFVENIRLKKRHLSFAGARSQMNTIFYQNHQEKRKIEQICLWNPMITRIYYVNIDLRHQYGISVAESQTFFLAKRPQR